MTECVNGMFYFKGFAMVTSKNIRAFNAHNYNQQVTGM